MLTAMNKANHKKCRWCEETKHIDQFPVRSNGTHRHQCKACLSQRASEDRRKRADHYYRTSRDRRLQNNYGITLEEYEKVFEEQGGVCRLCGQEQDRPLSVDHCHTTGKLRGLVCIPCNSGLAWYEEQGPVKIATYIEAPSPFE